MSDAYIRRALRWIAPSVVAACAGGLIVGLFEGSGDGERVIATTGLVCMLVVPALLAASCTTRGVLALWKLETLFEGMREERGGMPRLAAWVGVAWLGALALAWAMFQGTWMAVSNTAFKPNSFGFIAPIMSVIAVLFAVALSRPTAAVFTRLARWIDRRWQRIGPGTLLHPRIIVGGALVTGLAGGFLIWALLVVRRVPQFSTTFLLGPLIAVLVAVAIHVAWTLPVRVRVVAGGVIGAATTAAIAMAWLTVRGRPEVALAIWVEEPISGVAIARLFDLEAIRGELPLDAFRPKERAKEHRDVVVITLEGVRADRTPPYGGPAAMPALAELAKRGTVFEWAFAPSNVAMRSLPSMLTGLQPQRVRGKHTPAGLRLDPRHVMLPERLRAAGYETAAFACCEHLWGGTGFARGIEHVVIDDDNPRLAAAARAWITGRTSTEPLLLWIHVRPTTPPDREKANEVERRAAYDRSLASVDTVIADVIAAFGARAPIVVVAGAHGEELGEHGQPFRADDLYNTQLRVPFVVAGPAIRAQVITENVSLVDLMPTVLDLAGYAAPPKIEGRSLAEFTHGTRRPDPSAVIYAAIISEKGTPSSSTVIRSGWKLIDTGGSLELYDMRVDALEKKNLSGQHTKVVTDLRAVLNARVKAGKADPF